MVVAGVVDHGEEPDDTQDEREPGCEHPPDRPHPDLTQQDEDEDKCSQHKTENV